MRMIRYNLMMMMMMTVMMMMMMMMMRMMINVISCSIIFNFTSHAGSCSANAVRFALLIHHDA